MFGVSLRTGKLDEDVLRAIDRAIPFPLIFELTWSGKRKAVAAFKRPSEADSTKWVVSDYFETEWVAGGCAAPAAAGRAQSWRALRRHSSRR